MKNLAIALSILVGTTVASAQTDTTAVPVEKEVIGTSRSESDLGKVKIERTTEYEKQGAYTDTTRFEMGKKKVTIITSSDDEGITIEKKSTRSKSDLSWWAGFDLGLNTMMDANHNFDIDGEFDFLNPRLGASRYVGFNLPLFKIRLIDDYVGFTSGVAFQIYNFNYNGSNNFQMGDSLFAVPSGDRNVTKNKLRVSYLGIPAMLEFNTSLNPRKSFHITAGVIGKMRIENMYKQKFSEGGNDNKTSIKGDIGFNRWGLDAVARVGYGYFTVFAQVGLIPLFDNTNAPDIHTFAAGIAFTFPD